MAQGHVSDAMTSIVCGLADAVARSWGGLYVFAEPVRRPVPPKTSRPAGGGSPAAPSKARPSAPVAPPPPQPPRKDEFRPPQWMATAAVVLGFVCVCLLVATVVLAVGRSSAAQRLREAEADLAAIQDRLDAAKAEQARLSRSTAADAGIALSESPLASVAAAAVSSGNEDSSRAQKPETNRSAGTHAFKISDAKSKVAKIRGDQEAEVTLVSGLGKDDAVTMGIRHGAGVLECEVKEKKDKWEVMERSGGGKALATFTRERGEGAAGDLLRLKVPKSDLLRLVTFVVGVTPGGLGPEIREEFSLADPITNGVDLTPAKRTKNDNLAIRECGSTFGLFSDKAASERLARILAAALGLELHVEFPGPRHAGSVDRDGSRQTLVIKRLQAHDGKPYDAGKYEICGVALDVLGGDLKSKDGSLPLRGWWIQDPTAGAPAEGRGVRIPVTWDEDDVLGPAKEKLAKAIEAKREAERVFAEAERKREDRALNVAGERLVQTQRAVTAAEEVVNNGRAALEPIRRIQNEMSLKDFQGVAMRMTLRRPGDDDEIVIVDSSK